MTTETTTTKYDHRVGETERSASAKTLHHVSADGLTEGNWGGWFSGRSLCGLQVTQAVCNGVILKRTATPADVDCERCLKSPRAPKPAPASEEIEFIVRFGPVETGASDGDVSPMSRVSGEGVLVADDMVTGGFTFAPIEKIRYANLFDTQREAEAAIERWAGMMYADAADLEELVVRVEERPRTLNPAGA